MVYGMLAVVAALVLWQSRAAGGEAHPPRHHRTLTVYSGHTSGGVPLTLSFNGTHLHSVSLRGLGRSCDGRYFFGWSPAVGAPGVRAGEYPFGEFRVEQTWQLPGWLIEGHLEGRLTPGDVDGSIQYSAYIPLGSSCHSEPVSFHAER
jgi:hypothetical protein